MIREQTTLKIAGSEIPMLALDDWKFWLLVMIATGLCGLWIWRKK
jgi:hypothetical protein